MPLKYLLLPYLLIAFISTSAQSVQTPFKSDLLQNQLKLEKVKADKVLEIFNNHRISVDSMLKSGTEPQKRGQVLNDLQKKKNQQLKQVLTEKEYNDLLALVNSRDKGRKRAPVNGSNP